MIQLNRTDCLWKLGQDLLYLFVYRPTPELTLPTAHLLTLYQQCYGRKFVPAIYGVKTLEGVIETVKSISKLMTVCTFCNSTYMYIHTCMYVYMYMYIIHVCVCACE